MFRVASVGIVVAIAAGCADSYSAIRASSLVALIAEQDIWAMALHRPMPEYPRASAERAASGVAVATVLIADDGSLRGVRVLEAPDRAIARSVRTTLESWTFRSPEIPTGAPAEGKITMYFEMDGASGRIVSSLERIAARDEIVRRRSAR
jgi:TonB family protein